MSAAPAPRPRLSGFCNPTLPRTPSYDPHQRCHGCDCRATGCPCNPEEPDPVPEDSAANKIQAEVTPLEAVPDLTPPAAIVGDLLDAVRHLDVAMKGYNPEDWTEALALLRELRRVTTITGQLDGTLVTWLYLHGEHGMHQHVPGIPGEVHIGRGRKKERWASADAVRAYVAAKIEANGGEFPDPENVVDWVLEVLPATASTSLRKTPIREAGLDLDEYYESLPGSPQVSVLI